MEEKDDRKIMVLVWRKKKDYKTGEGMMTTIKLLRCGGRGKTTIILWRFSRRGWTTKKLWGCQGRGRATMKWRWLLWRRKEET